MAKESMKAREVKRAKMVAKYAEKRAALKKIVNTGDPVEAFEAAQKLQRIPKNANPIRLHNRCKLTGPRLGGHRGDHRQKRRPPGAHQGVLSQGRRRGPAGGGGRNSDRHSHPQGVLRPDFRSLYQVRHAQRHGHCHSGYVRERAAVGR